TASFDTDEGPFTMTARRVLSRLRHIAASSTAALFLLVAQNAFAADEFRWQVDEEKGEADLLVGEQPVVRYMFAYDTSSASRRAETFKPYHHVFAPGSDRIITKGVGGLYTHHRGLFVGWNRIQFGEKSVDTWHGRGASQQHMRFVDKQADANS